MALMNIFIIYVIILYLITHIAIQAFRNELKCKKGKYIYIE